MNIFHAKELLCLAWQCLPINNVIHPSQRLWSVSRGSRHSNGQRGQYSCWQARCHICIMGHVRDSTHGTPPPRGPPDILLQAGKKISLEPQHRIRKVIFRESTYSCYLLTLYTPVDKRRKKVWNGFYVVFNSVGHILMVIFSSRIAQGVSQLQKDHKQPSTSPRIYRASRPPRVCGDSNL